MPTPLFIVDAFAEGPFEGNPAAVCPLSTWLSDDTLQNIAAQNNLSETAFIVQKGDDFEIRWVTPTVEVDLCGHATLASAFVVCTQLDPKRRNLTFHSQSGALKIRREGEAFVLDFPARPATETDIPDALTRGLGAEPQRVLQVDNYLAVFESADDIRNLRPDFGTLAKELDHSVIVTAPSDGDGDELDFVSRYFAPLHGIDEDPVTGSAHCTLAPYWAERLRKVQLRGRQISARGGTVGCFVEGDRVHLSGKARLYAKGEIMALDA